MFSIFSFCIFQTNRSVWCFWLYWSYFVWPGFTMSGREDRWWWYISFIIQFVNIYSIISYKKEDVRSMCSEFFDTWHWDLGNDGWESKKFEKKGMFDGEMDVLCVFDWWIELYNLLGIQCVADVVRLWQIEIFGHLEHESEYDWIWITLALCGRNDHLMIHFQNKWWW